MTTTHTPGPWHYETSEDGARLWVGCPQYTVATVHETADRVEIGAMQANARLIAAAPELLAALQGILDVASVRIDDPRIKQWDAARMAIAKAGGDK